MRMRHHVLLQGDSYQLLQMWSFWNLKYSEAVWIFSVSFTVLIVANCPKYIFRLSPTLSPWDCTLWIMELILLTGRVFQTVWISLQHFLTLKFLLSWISHDTFKIIYLWCAQHVGKVLVPVIRNQTVGKVVCYFINIHQINKLVSAACVCNENHLDLRKRETRDFMGIAALVGGKKDTTHCYHGNTEWTAVPQSN